MPRGPVDKNVLLAHIYNLKHQLDHEEIPNGEKWKAHEYLSKVLDKLMEFGY